ncbi:MAG: hypothetical protein ACYC35_23510 [Pirellulales bacterium]
MKKLLVLAAVAVLTAGAAGCQACRMPWRGASYCPPAAVEAPVASPCEPCMTPPSVEPGAAYIPGPG